MSMSCSLPYCCLNDWILLSAVITLLGKKGLVALLSFHFVACVLSVMFFFFFFLLFLLV